MTSPSGQRRGQPVRWLAAGVVALAAACADTAAPAEEEPEHEPPVDSIILVDEEHNNFHTLSTTYRPLSSFLEQEGYTLRRMTTSFGADILATGRVLITSNALHASNRDDWSLPTPSAFSAAEIEAVRVWVEAGGALLLVADHMPFAGAAADLAASFGVTLNNGFAFDTTQYALPETCLRRSQVHIYRRADGTLADHAITNGRDASERIDSVATFTGQAFDPDGVMAPLMVFNDRSISIMPREAWVWSDTTIVPVGGWLQGGVLEYGQGRIAIFGEAAMFTSQTCSALGSGEQVMGWQGDFSGGNKQLLINTVRWLSKGL